MDSGTTLGIVISVGSMLAAIGAVYYAAKTSGSDATAKMIADMQSEFSFREKTNERLSILEVETKMRNEHIEKALGELKELIGSQNESMKEFANLLNEHIREK